MKNNDINRLLTADIIKIGESSEDALYELYRDVRKALQNQRITPKEVKELTYVLGAIRSFITDRYSIRMNRTGNQLDNPLKNQKVYRFFS